MATQRCEMQSSLALHWSSPVQARPAEADATAGTASTADAAAGGAASAAAFFVEWAHAAASGSAITSEIPRNVMCPPASDGSRNGRALAGLYTTRQLGRKSIPGRTSK